MQILASRPVALLCSVLALSVLAREGHPGFARAPYVQQETSSERANPASEPAPRGQNFVFQKTDLDLLHQLDAFDRYMEEKGWVINDPNVNAYLENVAALLLPKKTPENVKWRFRVIRDPSVNAFALSNGSVYVNSGLLSRLENQTQLAGVLGHEITHVTNRHTYLAYHSMRKKVVALDILSLASSGAYYGGVNYGIISAMNTLLPIIVVSTIYGYSREMEHEADVHSVYLLDHLHYDILEYSRALELLRNGPEVDLSKESVFWADHPKLADRIKDTNSLAAQLQSVRPENPNGQERYRAATKAAIRHDAELALLLGKPRTAVAIAQRLLSDEPSNADYYALLGDAYRSLGARTPTPEQAELTEEAKSAERKRLNKMTPAEYEEALLADPHGSERWEANCARADEAFQKALALDASNAAAYRGLGFLREKQGQRAEAISSFQRYLTLAPGANDVRQVKAHVEKLQEQTSGNSSKALK